MLEDTNPNIEGVPSDEEEDDEIHYQNNMENISNEQVQEVEQEPIDNIQQPINNSLPIQSKETPTNYDDILLKSSLGDFNDMNFAYSNSNIIHSEQPMEESTEPQIQQPIECKMEKQVEQPNEQYNMNNMNNMSYMNEMNNMNGQQQVYNSYPNIQQIENPLIASAYNQNQDIVYSTVHPINNYQGEPEMNPQYNGEQNIMSNPLEQTANFNNYSENSNIVNSSNIPSNASNFYNNNFNQTLKKSSPKIVTNINMNSLTMKKPSFKNNKENQNINLSKKENDSILNNLNKTEYPTSLRKNNSKKIKNNKIRNKLNTKDLMEMDGIKNFSPDFWRIFYDKDDPFFQTIPENEIIPNQILNDKNRNEIYCGDINREGQKHGFGKLINISMERIGSWKNNQFTGWGREVRKTGEIIEGKFIGGVLNGKGIYKDAKLLYVGNFINNIRHGKGELFTGDYHYIGNFNNNEIDGKGRIELYNDGIYEGKFNNGEITGHGVFKFNNGNFYEGEMKEGKMHGSGKLTLENGIIKEGRFVDGVFQEEGAFKNIKPYKSRYN